MPINRALGRMILQELAPSGLGVNALMRAVRAKGYGYKAELLNADARLFSGRYKNEYWIDKIGTNQVIPESLMSSGPLEQPYKYRVHYKSNWYEPSTDSYLTMDESIYTNDLAKKEDWIRANEERVRGTDSEFLELEYISTNITAVDLWDQG